MPENTKVAAELMTRCPYCGAPCYAVLDLDEKDRCNECRDKYTHKGSFKPGNSTKFQKGNKASPGRPPGAKGKTVMYVRTAVAEIMANNVPKLQQDLDRMSPFNRWQILDRLMKYFMPTLVVTPEEEERNNKLMIKVVYGKDEADTDVNQPATEVEIEGDEAYGYDEGEDITEDADYIEYKDNDK